MKKYEQLAVQPVVQQTPNKNTVFEVQITPQRLQSRTAAQSGRNSRSRSPNQKSILVERDQNQSSKSVQQDGIGQQNINQGIDQAQTQALENDFQSTLQLLSGDEKMNHFRQEFEKLHRALNASYGSEQRLYQRCKQLNDSIQQNAKKVQEAAELSQ